MTDNVSAFLDMLAVSEGTKGHGDDGYNVIVGGDLFHGYDDHPRRLVTLNKAGLKSTAAGRYQFLARTWDALRLKLHLRDFSPASQDVAATELIDEQHALDDVKAGRLDDAVAKCAPIWASLPGAGYGQHENELTKLRGAFVRAGGVLA
jgi:muramidase (phage lysozyme)